MPNTEEMTINERRKYLKKMKPLYENAKRQERSRLLSEMEQVTGLHRKSLLRLLGESSLERHPRTTPRSRHYGMEVERVIVTVWESLDYICAERLTPALLETAQHLERFGVVQLTPDVQDELATISRATVERILGQHRSRRFRLPQPGPEAANRLRQNVPMKRLPWDLKEPGHFEVDLVHHCGASTIGEYLHTLQMIDVATGWSERVAVLGRSQKAMEEGFRLILGRVPFPVKQLHPDNGSEFFNDHLVRFWGEAITGLTLSRSRPYHKNDNRFVEQKNDTLVRQYFGFLRLEHEQFVAMNALYDQMWVYYHFFQPVLHLCEKSFEEGKIQRKWDQAQTPYQRLQMAAILSPEQFTSLQEIYVHTNPYLLRKRIYQRLTALWDEQACCTSVSGEDASREMPASSLM